MYRPTFKQALESQLAKRLARNAAQAAREKDLVARMDAIPVRCMCGQMSTTHIAEDGLRRTDCCGAH